MRKYSNLYIAFLILGPLIGWLAAEIWGNYYFENIERIKTLPVVYAYKQLDCYNARALFTSRESCLGDVQTYHDNECRVEPNYLPECPWESIDYNQTLYFIDSSEYDGFSKIAFIEEKDRGEIKLFEGYVYNEMLQNEPPNF